MHKLGRLEVCKGVSDKHGSSSKLEGRGGSGQQYLLCKSVGAYLLSVCCSRALLQELCNGLVSSSLHNELTLSLSRSPIHRQMPTLWLQNSRMESIWCLERKAWELFGGVFAWAFAWVFAWALEQRQVGGISNYCVRVSLCVSAGSVLLVSPVRVSLLRVLLAVPVQQANKDTHAHLTPQAAACFLLMKSRTEIVQCALTQIAQCA